MAVFLFVLLTEDIINILLHGLGVYLLASSYRGTNRTTHHLYIMNLSASELSKNFAYLVGETMQLIIEYGVSASLLPTDLTRTMIFLIFTLYGSAMLFLTLDRLLTATLGDRFTMFWTTEKAKSSILVLWIFLTVLSIAFYVYLSTANETFQEKELFWKF